MIGWLMLKTIESILLRKTGFCAQTGIAGPSSFLSVWHIRAFFQAYHVSKSSSTKNQTLYLNHTFVWNCTVGLANSLSSCWSDHFCHEECTLRQAWLSILLEGVHANTNMIPTVHPGFLSIQTRYSQFHCSLLITSFRLSELPSIWIPYWFFRSGVGWRATLIRGK